MTAIVSAAEQRAHDGAAPAHERGAAEHHRRDDVEFEADGRVRGAGAETRRDHDAGDRGSDAGEGIDGGDDPARRHADAARRLGIGADRHDLPAVFHAVQHDIAEDRGDQRDDGRQRQAEQASRGRSPRSPPGCGSGSR